MNKKTLLIGFVLIVLAGAGVWYAVARNGNSGPTRPPTADELRRIQDIDEKSSQKADNAVPGVGVAAPGTLPPPSQPTEEATTSEASNTEIE